MEHNTRRDIKSKPQSCDLIVFSTACERYSTQWNRDVICCLAETIAWNKRSWYVSKAALQFKNVTGKYISVRYYDSVVVRSIARSLCVLGLDKVQQIKRQLQAWLVQKLHSPQFVGYFYNKHNNFQDTQSQKTNISVIT